MPYRDPEKRRAYNARRRERSAKWMRDARAADPEKYRARGRARYAEDPAKQIFKRMRRCHGLSPGDWALLWAAQDGRCYLCGDELAEGAAVIEHDHRCCPRNYSCQICRRGVACGGCNNAIGLAQDDPARLRRIADALEAAKLLVDQRMAEAGERLTLF